MDLTQKNFKELLIAKDVNVGGSTMAEMNAGEVGLFTPSGKRIVASSAGTNEVLASAADRAMFVKKRADGTFQISDVIKKSEVKSVKAGEFKARKEQITYVGFNGTDGELDVINDNQYIGRFVFDNLLVSNHSCDYIKHIQYKSPTSGTTQEKIALGLMKSAIANFAREEDDIVSVERVNSASGTATADNGGGSTAYEVGTITVVKGSKTISAEDIDGGTTALAVGDYVRFGTAKTDAVYKVVSVDSTGNTATLDAEYQGANGTFAHTEAQVIPAATIANGDYGLKVTGQPLASVVGKFLPSIVSFQMTLQNFGITEVNYAQGAFIGSNTAEIIKAEEFFYQGNQGETLRYDRNTYAPIAEAENINYNSVEVIFAQTEEVGSLNILSPNQVKVAFPDGASNDVWSKSADGLQAVVNAYFGTSFSIS